MNILQVNTFDLGGGAESSAWNLFKEFRSRGYDSWLAVGQKYSQDPGVFVIPKVLDNTLSKRGLWSIHARIEKYEGRVSGIGALRTAIRKTITFPNRARRRMGVENLDLPGTWKLLDLPPRRPSIIHCHNLHGSYFDLRALPWLSRQVPVILNLRDSWLLSGHCAQSFDCDRWKTGCGKCPDLTIYPAIERDATAYNWTLKRSVYKRCRLYITAPSRWQMDKVKESMLSGVEYRVIPNGIDLSVFIPGSQAEARVRLNLPLDMKIILLVAHSEFRDYDTMEKAVARLKKTTNQELLFVCLGRAEAEKEVGEGRMIFPGFVQEPEELAQYYRAADVYIHAARDETFGKTITEALACGTPVVATAVGGIPEQIVDGETGYLVPGRDSEKMAEQVMVLLADDELRKKMGYQAAMDAKERFDLKRQADNFLSWYQEILENHSHAH